MAIDDPEKSVSASARAVRESRITETAMPRSALTRMVAAAGLTNLADGVALVAWAWLATLLTRDPLLVALPPVALRLPWLLLALPAGVVADRVDRRRLLLVMDALRALAFGLAALGLWSATPLPPAPPSGASDPGLFALLICCALLVGAAEVFRDTAAQTILPAIVPAAALERANARLFTAEITGNALLGPALGAFLIAAAVWLPFDTNAVLLVVAWAVVRGLSGRFAPPSRMRQDWRKDLGEGIAFMRGQGVLQLLAAVTAVWNLFHQMVVIALVLHGQENLGLDAPAYGMILAAGAFGGVTGGLVAERGVRRIGPGAAARISSLCSAIGFALIGLAPDALTLALALVFFEFTSIFWNVVSVSYRQRVVPGALLGRVNGIYRLLSWGSMALGLLLSGVVVRAAETLVVRETALIVPFALAALAVLVLTITVWRRLGRGFGATAEAKRLD
ncbi:MAG: MFS transporter [Pseudomonadota bacterium]